MSRTPFSITVKDQVALGPDNIPKELISNQNLVYSSPATLSYNAPGAQGYGVKRAGLVIPESIELLISPACCGRNTTILGDEGGYSDKMFFLQMDETDIVTGRYLSDIPQAIKEILETCKVKPKVVVLCITCVDALLGTDLERVCRKAEKEVGIRVAPSYMYALTREGNNPPMIAIREAIYGLLEKRNKNQSMVNFIGNFTHLEDNCEIYDLFHKIGLKEINEIGRMETFEEYLTLAEANFNLILNPEARRAAVKMESLLDIPYAELTRVYQIDKIQKQYMLLGAALGVTIDDQIYYEKAQKRVAEFIENYQELTFAVGQVLNANTVEMALALSKYGFKVKSIFCNAGAEDMPYLRQLEQYSPDTKIYSTLSPSMMYYEEAQEQVDISLGLDASYYYPQSVNVPWNDEIQPFGYTGLIHLIDDIERLYKEGK